MRQLVIDERHAGQRLDNFLLRELKGVSRSLIYRIVRRGEVRVNGGRVKPMHRLEQGDTVRVPPVSVQPSIGAAEDVPEALLARIEAAIMHEDNDLIALDKPAGLAVHGGSGLRFGLIEALRAARPHAPFLELAHRLDRETSGLLLIAKSRECLTRLHTLLRGDGMDKRYLALVHGAWQGGARQVDLPLIREGERGGRRNVSVDDHGIEAHSEFKPMRRLPEHTLMEVRIGTGRTHQIRVHAAHIGHPVVGDARYGDFGADRGNRALGLRRQFLHAAELRFQMPVTGRRYHFKSDLPPDLQGCLDSLESA
ncbi:hypothetical protein Thpro_020623 [Acidihalobacter prosperus]|uniref:Pseudouridine synthase n=1 Tax=Acidihalobacter prosperus TaxID=160660 RepID=A0A1A6C8L2_9GAMM|nr:hypothetical protein Thpro_020623 [Acidihalobacter prosperus]